MENRRNDREGGSDDDRRVTGWSPFGIYAMRSPTSIMSWFDQHMARLEEDLFRNRFFDMPYASQMAFDPERRSRLFDALFSPDDDTALPMFHTNPTKNQIECQIGTGCGDFFRPEDVEVNVSGRNVELKARREQRSADGNSYAVREVRRLVTVPENADLDRLQAEMAPNGKLLISAPLTTPPPAPQPQKLEGPVPLKINRLPQ